MGLPGTAAAASKTGRSVIPLLASNAIITGATLSKARPDYSGDGYATGFKSANDKMLFTFRDAAGFYKAVIRYCSPSGPKGYDMVLNGADMSGMFSKSSGWTQCNAGTFLLKKGNNSLSIGGGWGYYDIDSVTLFPVAAPKPARRPPLRLCDAHASAATKALFTKLWGMYGKKTGSGCYSPADALYIHRQTGKYPLIMGGDLMDYSPSRIAHGANPKGAIQQLITEAHKGYILTISWHWNAPMHLINKTYVDKTGKTIKAPWWSGFYTYATTFSLAQALSNKKSSEYKALISNIDAIAVQLEKLQRANVPVLWRPLHEAEGGWFWWGASGSQPFKQLWHILYHRLTVTHKLHNLIWVYTSGGDMNWYPGDKYVDVVGIDAYPKSQSDPLSAQFEQMKAEFSGRKLLAISEFGGVPNVSLMHQYGEFWDYFVSWNGTVKSTPVALLSKTYSLKSTVHKP
jgi:mannan endo-1,4-beta-mannosidase